MTVPYSFATATAAIPLSQLDSNFNTAITLGNTAIQLGNTVTTLNNMTLANVTISSGNVTITNVTVTTANVTTLNATTANVTTANITTDNVTFANITGENVTTSNVTTLTLTNNPTLNGGTANGVLYLNGSKVATSGSTLTFNGSTFKVTTGAGGISAFFTDATYSSLKIDHSDTSGLVKLLNGANDAMLGLAGDNLRFYLTGSEQMRLTSTGLGIGTTPVAKLHVAKSGSVTFRLEDLSTNYWDFVNNSNLTFNRGGTDKMVLDASGNLGLGVTPSAWNSVYRTMQLGAGASLSGRTDNATWTELMSNTYRASDGTWKYITTNSASLYAQNAGAHAWYYAASGTAGNAISFTQAMTLDASGNLGIGTTSPTTKLSITDSTGPIIRLVRTSNRFEVSADNDFMSLNARDASTYITFRTADTERARITSGGDLLVGTTSNATYGEKFNVSTGSSTQTIMNLEATGTSSFGAVKFRNGSGEIGSISYLSSSVVYNTTSDYRLKKVIGGVSGQGERIDALEPIEYEWKANGTRTRGFLAHKFQEVYPQSVTGEKDAVDVEGKPVYQQMQASTAEVIADLVAEIKSLRVRVAQLEKGT